MANRWLYNIESKNKQNENKEADLEFQEEDVWDGFMIESEGSKEEHKDIQKSVSISWPPRISPAAWGLRVSPSPKMKQAKSKSWENISKKCSVEHSLGLVKIPDKTKNRHVPDDEDYDGDDEMVPPHEYLAKKSARERVTMLAYSMLEGIGRTLKGRDLCRLRNAVFSKTGYVD